MPPPFPDKVNITAPAQTTGRRILRTRIHIFQRRSSLARRAAEPRKSERLPPLARQV
jgi:hypothetical protein